MAAVLREENTDLLLAELVQVRELTDRLFARVPPRLLYERAIPERHRPIFYVGHLEAFDANLLCGADTDFGQRFAFGIDPVDGALPADRAEDWPPLAQVREGALQARQRVDDALHARLQPRLLHAAIEHRLMHAETLGYLLNRLPLDKPVRALPTRLRKVDAGAPVPIPAGPTTLGGDADALPFAWDNEVPAHVTSVPAFEIDRHMVTNGQFLRFIEDGGYDDPRWWTGEDWAWRCAGDVRHPAAWRRHDGQWTHVSLLDLVPFQADWPVQVSHAEASAYARWAGQRLPTEAEWQRAAYGDGEATYPWGEASPQGRGNFDFAQWDPAPVDAHPSGASPFGVVGLLGNGWEWTSTPFAPLPGFEPQPFYRGYSADFFDGRHFVLKGGSAHTAARLLRRSFRNWFQPRYPYPFAGFRCVGAS